MFARQPQAIFLIGLQGSGKSFWLTRYMATAAVPPVVIGTDHIIDTWAAEQGMTYTEAFRRLKEFRIGDKSGFKAVNAEMMRRLKAAIAADQDFVNDQTNVTVKSRRGKLALVPPHYHKKAVVFTVPDAVLKARLAQRAAEGKFVPMDVIEEKARSYVRPTKSEFHEIIDVKSG